MAGNGWLPFDIDRLTLGRVQPLLDHWEKHPPTHHLVALIARMLGWKGPEPAPKSLPELEAEAAQFGVPVVHGAVPDMPPVLDEEALAEKNRRRRIEIAARNAQKAAA